MAKTLFWISAAAILYTYIGYPFVVWMVARLRNRKISKVATTPRVTVVVACHNEAQNIEARLNNLLASDYPAHLLKIVVVSDGSRDETVRLARRGQTDRLRVIAHPHHVGKAAALSLAVNHAEGEIIVFADARQRFETDAIRELVASFSDPRVGAVSGELMLDDGSSGVSEGVGLYWKYEKFIRKSESLAGSVIGATGAIYAIRRELWEPLPPGTILDDVYTPMRIALCGHRVVFEERALAHDRPAESARREFARKVRTLAGNYQLCQLMPRLLAPTNWLLFQFFSHKLMRLAAPIMFLLMFGASATLAVRQASVSEAIFYQTALAMQIVFYASVPVSMYLMKRNRKVRLLNVAYVFSVMNAAALVGLFYFLLGKRNLWVRGE
jgi:poly-beta-1,6-N-acetyl-D-glucosamine synthase